MPQILGGLWAAVAPSAAAVTIWRRGLVRMSPGGVDAGEGGLGGFSGQDVTAGI